GRAPLSEGHGVFGPPPLGWGGDRLSWRGEDGLPKGVLGGRGGATGPRQSQSGERRPAEVEKVIPPADLLLGDAKHLGPRGRQPAFGRRTRPLVVLLSDTEFSGERR